MTNLNNARSAERYEQALKKFGTFAWQNGEMKPVAEAEMHMLSHAVQYGTGAFEGIRCHHTDKGPAIFRLRDHLQRFRYSMECLHLPPPHTTEEFTEACRQLVRMNMFHACYLRPFVYSGLDDLGLKPAPLEAGIAARAWVPPTSVKGQVSDVRRLSPRAFKPDAKLSGHYVNSISANADASAKRPGTTALLLDESGNVAEMSAANVFLVLGNELHTPKTGSILPGMTRDTVMTLARAEGMPVYERDITPAELHSADEIFVTGTAVGVAPMLELNGTLVNGGAPGQCATRLRTLYYDVVQGRASEYAQWLTPVHD